MKAVGVLADSCRSSSTVLVYHHAYSVQADHYSLTNPSPRFAARPSHVEGGESPDRCLTFHKTSASPMQYTCHPLSRSLFSPFCSSLSLVIQLNSIQSHTSQHNSPSLSPFARQKFTIHLIYQKFNLYPPPQPSSTSTSTSPYLPPPAPPMIAKLPSFSDRKPRPNYPFTAEP